MDPTPNICVAQASLLLDSCQSVEREQVLIFFRPKTQQLNIQSTPDIC